MTVTMLRESNSRLKSKSVSIATRHDGREGGRGAFRGLMSQVGMSQGGRS